MRNRFKHIYLDILKPYLAIVVVVLLIMLTFSLSTFFLMKEEINDNISRFTSFFNNALDESLVVIEDYAYNLTFSSKSDKINDYPVESSHSSNFLKDAYNLVYNIRSFISTDGVVDDIMIYYPARDGVVGKRGYYNTKSYFVMSVDEKLNDYSNNEYQEWVDNVLNSKNDKYFMYKLGDKPAEVYFKQSTPVWLDSQRTVLFRISRTAIEEMINSLFLSTNYGFAALIDDNNNIFASAGDTELLNKYLENNTTSGKYLAFKEESSISGFNFIVIQQYGTAYNVINIAIVILSAGLLLALIAGVVLSLRYSSKKGKLISVMASKLTPSEEMEANRSSLEQIDQRIDALIQEKSLALKEADFHQHLIESFFLKDLILTEESHEDIDNQCAHCGIEFNEPIFSIIVISPSETNLSKQYKLIEKNSSANFDIIVTTIENTDIYLCNYNVANKSSFNDFFKGLCNLYKTDSARIFRGFASLADAVSAIKDNLVVQNDSGEVVLSKKKTDTRPIAEIAHDIIEKEFSNPQMGLGIIAERLDVSQSYLSKQFKLTYDIGLNNYMNALRIEAAKEMLKSGDDNLADIAVSVGFLSDVNLIRVFKKFENTTPGSFRVNKS